MAATAKVDLPREKARSGSRKAGKNGDQRQATEAGLDLLRVLGWMIVHDVVIPGAPGQVVDHVAAGPSGVYVINTVGTPGAITIRDDDLFCGQASLAGELNELADAVAQVRSLLDGHPVAPLLCFVRGEEFSGFVDGVAVCSTENVLDVLTAQRGVFDGTTQAAVARVLNQALSTADAPRIAPPVALVPPSGKHRHGPRFRRSSRQESAPEPIQVAPVVAVEVPVAKTVAAKPVVKAPVIQAPVVEAPVVKAPVVEAPAPVVRRPLAPAAPVRAVAPTPPVDVPKVVEPVEVAAVADVVEPAAPVVDESARLAAERAEADRVALEAERAKIAEERAKVEEQRRVAAEDRARFEVEREQAARERDEAQRAREQAEVQIRESTEQRKQAALDERRTIAEERRAAAIEREEARVARREVTAEQERIATEQGRIATERKRVVEERRLAEQAEARAITERKQAAAERKVAEIVRAKAERQEAVIARKAAERAAREQHVAERAEAELTAHRVGLAEEAEAARTASAVPMPARFAQPPHAGMHAVAPVAAESEKAPRRHSLAGTVRLAVVLAIAAGLVLGVGPRIPDVLTWGKGLLGATPAAAYGAKVEVAANAFHPDVTVVAGTPTRAKAATGSVPRGSQLFAVPLDVVNGGVQNWVLKAGSSVVVVDSLGVEHRLARGVTAAGSAKAVPTSVPVAAGKDFSGSALFTVPTGRSVAEVKVKLSEADGDTLVWKAGP